MSATLHVPTCPSSPSRRMRLATLHSSKLAHRQFAARWSLTTYSRLLEDWCMREVDSQSRWSNKSLQATRDGRSSSAGADNVIRPACLSSER